jgi:phosphate uptake regulator
MKRRIVQHGSSSLTVTLPSKWVQQHNLKKGDEVDVLTSSDAVTISAKRQLTTERKVIDSRDFGRFTRNNICHLYLLGYDELEIIYDDESTLTAIQAALPECIGYEIIDQKPKRVYIKSIAHTFEKDFDFLLRKSFQITSELAAQVHDAIKGNNHSALKEIRHLEQINNKFTMCCARILTKEGYKVQNRTLQMYEAVKRLERIADHYKYICDCMVRSTEKASPAAIRYLGDVNAYYELFHKLFFKFDPKSKEQIYSDKKTLEMRGTELLLESSKKEREMIHHLLNIVSTTYDTASSYFAIYL